MLDCRRLSRWLIVEACLCVFLFLSLFSVGEFNTCFTSAEFERGHTVYQGAKRKGEGTQRTTFMLLYYKQEHTMFDDLRRGFSKDIQGLIEFERSKIAQKIYQNLSVFFALLTSKMISKFKFNLIRPT